MNFIFKLFIKDHENVNDPKVRDNYGKLAGVAGIISNLILSAMKYIIGMVSGSIAIMADAVNNLADASSSVITLIGFKLASLPEDEEHPYGHARIEYIAGMIVSMIIIVVGFELGKESVLKIINPVPVEFSIIVVIVLLIAIALKILQALFNISAGKKINSVALIATGADSRNDVISTSAVLVSLIIGKLTDFNVDGYMGVIVALFIIYSGISLVKETVSPLLGEAADPEIAKTIEETCLKFDGVLGIHDLVVHNYGPGKVFASVHIEVDAERNVLESHDIVDSIEFRLKKELGIEVTGHLDPIDLKNEHREPIQDILIEAIADMEGVLNFHDLRFVPGPTHTNVLFDILLSPECKIPQAEISGILRHKISEYDEKFFTVISYDKSYVKSGSAE